MLVSQAVVDAAGTAGAIFDEVGPVELKGVSGALKLHVARRTLASVLVGAALLALPNRTGQGESSFFASVP